MIRAKGGQRGGRLGDAFSNSRICHSYLIISNLKLS